VTALGEIGAAYGVAEFDVALAAKISATFELILPRIFEVAAAV
jgi:hypothetical protein